MHERIFTVDFGDCDEAGIVFRPGYFSWLDCTFQRLLRERGLSQRELRRRFGAVTPLVDAAARFRSPASYDKVIVARAEIDRWEERRFRIAYRFDTDERTVAEGHEVRVWAALRPEGGIRGTPVDPAFRAELGAAGPS